MSLAMNNQSNLVAVLYSKPTQYLAMLLCLIIAVIFISNYFNLKSKDNILALDKEEKTEN